jgi:tetratricopeptide (TPR) repeat protein
MEQITEIKAASTNQQKKDDKYSAALETGDHLFAERQYKNSLAAYTEAVELKKNEKYPQDQIAKINKIIADSQNGDENYILAIKEGDKLFAAKDYSSAISAFNKAAVIKPSETYPKQRIAEINAITAGIASSHTSEYNKALEVADKLYNTKVYDQAIEAYEAAAKINPADAYPELQIGKIRKYISDHTILDLNSEALVISKGNEKKFSFSAIDPSQRKNNYILIKVRSTGNTVPKVYLNYGKNDQKNGGIVLRNLDKSTISDLLISISIQDKWFREDNNWISVSVETGDIEITKVQIAAGE